METLIYSTIFTLAIGCSLGYFTFLLHATHFVEEYAKLLCIDGWLQIEEFKKWNENTEGEYNSYPVYLSFTYPNFLTKMIGCPYCFMSFLCFWGSVVLALIKLSPVFLLMGTSAAFIAGISYMLSNLLYKKM